MKNLSCLLTLLLLIIGVGNSVEEFSCICSTDVPFATGPSNSHKLAGAQLFFDTLGLVFQTSTDIHVYFKVDTLPWSGPVCSHPGKDPGIDFGYDNCFHLVWVSGSDEILYRNLNSGMSPVKVSPTSGNCAKPDVWADSSGLAHIVWEDYTYGAPRIYYRTANVNGTVGDTFLVSSTTSGSCLSPSIGFCYSDTLKSDTFLVVLWQEFDTLNSEPYSIKRRCSKNGVWLSEETLACSQFPLRNPSLGNGAFRQSQTEYFYDIFSAAWADSSSGNFEAHFEGGNPGGGYPTAGRSSVPVLSTLGTTWSYLFWQEDSGGITDICHHFYYWGWRSSGSLRRFLNINENIYSPSCFGCLLVFTQGDSPPYKVMFADFELPIGVKEQKRNRMRLSASNPTIFTHLGTVSFEIAKPSFLNLVVYDANGRLVRTIESGYKQSGCYQAVWDGRDEVGRKVSNGVYFYQLKTDDFTVTKKGILMK